MPLIKIESIQKQRKIRDEAIKYIKSQTSFQPEIIIILGSGLGKMTHEIETECVIPYENIPHFPLSTVKTHQGKLWMGTLAGKKVMIQQGRFHIYEGYTMQDIVFPLRVAYGLGAKTLIVSNACGTVNTNLKKGDVMLITDHINMLGGSPLIGPNDDELGERFPDMSAPYSEKIIQYAKEVALDNKIDLHKGVYCALTGPALETKAEYRFLKIIGADAVGMSTVPEVIAAVHMKMEVMGISIITDECFPDALSPLSFEEVVAAGNKGEPKMTTIIKGVLKRI